MANKIKVLVWVILAAALIVLPQIVVYADPIPWPGG